MSQSVDASQVLTTDDLRIYTPVSESLSAAGPESHGLSDENKSCRREFVAFCVVNDFCKYGHSVSR